MRAAATIPVFLLTVFAMAQWDVPVSIVLDGAQPGDRQVTGLADPIAANSAVSVAAARDQVTSFTTVTGDAILSGDLDPAPAAYTAGMLITIVPTMANAVGARLDLNGLGPQDVVKQGGLPLDSADLIVGSPVRLIHDGSQFRVIGSTLLPCPAGFSVGGREYCIEDTAHGDTTFYWAVRLCRDRGARLCTISEWANACRNQPAFLSTVLNYEWIDSAANNDDNAKIIGKGQDADGNVVIGCEVGNTSLPTSGTNRRHRCCTNR